MTTDVDETENDKATRMGRPSGFTKKISAEICERLAAGEPLIEICADDHLPTRQTVWNWISARPDFFDAYQKARQIGVQAMADQVLLIAKDEKIDTARAKVIVSALQWYVSRFDRPTTATVVVATESSPHHQQQEPQSDIKRDGNARLNAMLRAWEDGEQAGSKGGRSILTGTSHR
jgi:hypothetical protein